MDDKIVMNVIARVRTDFTSKFGIPRQSALAEGLTSLLVFEPEYRDANALRGIEQFSHLWLLWCFSENIGKGWSPTVRPPRLGGNDRVGVFATRSPFRPNPVGLSCARLIAVEHTREAGTVLRLGGTDLMDGTPVLDIKPYIPYADSIPEALEGYTKETRLHRLEVVVPPELETQLPQDKKIALRSVLEQDPRPSYQSDPDRVYGFDFAGMEIRFRVRDGVLIVTEIIVR